VTARPLLEMMFAAADARPGVLRDAEEEPGSRAA